MANNHVLTIATGNLLYLDMAVNLSYSFLLWNKTSEIEFILVTDQPEKLPGDLDPRIVIKPVSKGEFVGFSSKLFLDRLAPEGNTLFIDSDCLIYGNLEPLFERFKGRAVAVAGDYISEGEWFGDVKNIRRQFNLLRYPKFNGGLYYIEKGETARRVYDEARNIEKDYDRIGFVRLRNRPNDEVIMALAMELNNQTPLIDDGTILSDFQSCPGKHRLNILKGERVLTNPPKPHPLHRDWYPFQKVSPLIVHFLGAFTQQETYLRETRLLRKVTVERQAPVIAKVMTWAIITVPFKLLTFFKNLFRMPYRLIFGYRKIKLSNRI